MKASSSVKILLCAFVFFINKPAKADNVVLGLGLLQPFVFHGSNIEVDYLTEHWVFEYSHGMNLKISDFKQALTQSEQDQNLSLQAFYSTGFGIGYRFTEEWNLRLEFKEHRFEVKHPSGESITYTNSDIGIGAYYFWKPLNHLMIIPSLRYWPTLTSTLSRDGYLFANGDIHKPHSFGLFGNLTIGWMF